jgi:hypothetical protein
MYTVVFEGFVDELVDFEVEPGLESEASKNSQWIIGEGHKRVERGSQNLIVDV